MSSVQAKLPVYWIPDSSTEKCKLCSTAFGYLLRKHHCRRCGHIFCSTCANNFGSIPSYLPKTLHYSDVGSQVRLCTPCLTEINTAKKSRTLVEVLSFLPLKIDDFKTLRTISHAYLESTNYILSVLKGLPYKLTYDKFSKIEKRIVRNHWKAFTGHSKYMIQALRCMTGITSDTTLSNIIRMYKKGTKVEPCQNLFCTECCNTLQTSDVLEILYGYPGKEILENQEAEVFFGTILANVDIDDLSLFIPYYLTIGTTEACQRIVNNYLLPRVLEDTNFAFKMYFECRLCKMGDTRVSDYYVSIMERILQLVDQTRRDELAKCDMLIHYLENPHVDKQKKVNELCPIIMPYNPSIIIKKVHLDQMVQLNTFTKPYVLPITTNVGLKRLLIKKEDLRKDRLVVIVKYILVKTIKNVKLTPYSVFPIHGSYGWIEMIDDVETLYDIQVKNTLQNYILERNSNLSITQIRRDFIRTCASNALLTYMIGVGDRNQHNILVKSTGELVNIDFSYLLGDDPKFKTQTMSITPAMVEMLGGRDSEGYTSLQNFCSKGFQKIRKQSSFWFVLFLYLAKTKPPILKLYNNIQQIRKFHEERLMCNLTEEESTVRITEIVNQNSSSSWQQYISEYSHAVTTTVTDFIFKLDM